MEAVLDTLTGDAARRIDACCRSAPLKAAALPFDAALDLRPARITTIRSAWGAAVDTEGLKAEVELIFSSLLGANDEAIITWGKHLPERVSATGALELPERERVTAAPE